MKKLRIEQVKGDIFTEISSRKWERVETERKQRTVTKRGRKKVRERERDGVRKRRGREREKCLYVPRKRSILIRLWKVIDLAASLLTRCISILSACLRKLVSILAIADIWWDGRSNPPASPLSTKFFSFDISENDLFHRIGTLICQCREIPTFWLFLFWAKKVKLCRSKTLTNLAIETVKSDEIFGRFFVIRTNVNQSVNSLEWFNIEKVYYLYYPAYILC